MGVKVSVVVTVRNPDTSADAGIRGVLEQTLPPDEYEVIFADDGSDERRAARLDAIAAVRDNVQVLHLPPSGSPARGRNAGLAAARGEYVYLLDQGDRLERDALARMYAKAVATEADVLIGGLAREGSGPPTASAADRDRADLLKDRLLSRLTPHKLFRRAFLDDHELRFPEREGTLAENAFVLRAYLSAKVIAVLAGRVCCHVAARPRPPENPATLAAEVRALLRIVDEHTVPGGQRDRVYAHWLRVAVLRPFTSRRFLVSSRHRGVLFRTLRELVLERFPARLDRHLPVHRRAVVALLRAGHLDRLCALAALWRGIRLRADLDAAHWEGDVLTLAVTAEIIEPDGTPMRLLRADDGRLYWRPPVPIDPDVLPVGHTEVSDAVARAGLRAYLRHEETGVRYPLTTAVDVALSREDGLVRVRLTGDLRLDPATAADGRPLAPGMWQVRVRAHGGPYRVRGRAGAEANPITCVGALTGRPRRLVVPCWTDDGKLAVCVAPPSFAESIALVSRAATTLRHGGHVFVVMPVPYLPPDGGPPVELVLRCGGREVAVPALAEPGRPDRMAGQLVAKAPVRLLRAEDCLSPGLWHAALRVAGREAGLRFALRVSRGGRVAPLPARPAPPPRATVMRRAARYIPLARLFLRPAYAGRVLDAATAPPAEGGSWTERPRWRRVVPR